MKNRTKVITLLSILSFSVTSVSLTQESNSTNTIGIFEDHHDWVAGMAPGEAAYDPNTGEYMIQGSSALYIDEENREIGMGGHVACSWICNDSNFELEAHVTAEFVSSGSIFSSAVLFVSEYDPPETIDLYNCGAAFGIGVTSKFNSLICYYQEKRGPYDMSVIDDEVYHEGRLKLVKDGNTIQAFFFDPFLEEWVLYGEHEMEFNTPELTVGLVASSGNSVNLYTIGRFTEVKLTIDDTPGGSDIPSSVSEPVGMFENHRDVFPGLMAAGETSYDPDTDEYVIIGSSYNNNYGHIAYSTFNSQDDFIFEGEILSEHIDSDDEWGGASLYIQEGDPASTLDDIENYSAFYCVGIAAKTQLISVWYQEIQGPYAVSYPANIGLECNHDGRIKIVKEGEIFSSYFFDPDLDDWILRDERILLFSEPTMVIGIFVGSSIDNKYSKGTFRNLKLTVNGIQSGVEDWTMYR